MIEITESLSIPRDELHVAVSTSSGPGGQRLNRVRTRVTLSFNVHASPSLTDAERERIVDRLGSRIDSSGSLRVRCQKHRSQGQNRSEAEARLATLLREALHEETPRQRTRKPRAAHQRRLDRKRRRSQIKASRGTPKDTGE